MSNARKQRLIYSGLMIVIIVAFWLFENFYTPATYSAPEGTETPTVFPVALLPGSTTGEVVKHLHYTLSYNEPYEQAEWVAYVLRPGHLSNIDRERPFFIEDPKVGSGSADWRNYKGSGYDRGHLCPAGDRRFSEFAYKETFYTSNIAPQRNGFNAGIWNDLEKQVRSWSRQYGTLYVITGGVLSPSLDRIGEEGVAVPEYYYKIVARGSGKQLRVICFLIPHRENLDHLQAFRAPVDEVEAISGIDFFPALPDTLENKIEAAIDKASWKF